MHCRKVSLRLHQIRYVRTLYCFSKEVGEDLIVSQKPTRKRKDKRKKIWKLIFIFKSQFPKLRLEIVFQSMYYTFISPLITFKIPIRIREGQWVTPPSFFPFSDKTCPKMTKMKSLKILNYSISTANNITFNIHLYRKIVLFNINFLSKW